MACFSNGTEGALYQEKYCYRCVNWRNDGCPVMDVHWLFAYGEQGTKSNAEEILNILIPMHTVTTYKEADQCSMFMLTERTDE